MMARACIVIVHSEVVGDILTNALEGRITGHGRLIEPLAGIAGDMESSIVSFY